MNSLEDDSLLTSERHFREMETGLKGCDLARLLTPSDGIFSPTSGVMLFSPHIPVDDDFAQVNVCSEIA